MKLGRGVDELEAIKHLSFMQYYEASATARRAATAVARAKRLANSTRGGSMRDRHERFVRNAQQRPADEHSEVEDDDMSVRNLAWLAEKQMPFLAARRCMQPPLHVAHDEREHIIRRVLGENN